MQQFLTQSDTDLRQDATFFAYFFVLLPAILFSSLIANIFPKKSLMKLFYLQMDRELSHFWRNSWKFLQVLSSSDMFKAIKPEAKYKVPDWGDKGCYLLGIIFVILPAILFSSSITYIFLKKKLNKAELFANAVLGHVLGSNRIRIMSDLKVRSGFGIVFTFPYPQHFL